MGGLAGQMKSWALLTVTIQATERNHSSNLCASRLKRIIDIFYTMLARQNPARSLQNGRCLPSRSEWVYLRLPTVSEVASPMSRNPVLQYCTFSRSQTSALAYGSLLRTLRTSSLDSALMTSVLPKKSRLETSSSLGTSLRRAPALITHQSVHGCVPKMRAFSGTD